MAIFEKFCKEYNLDYDFTTIGDGSVYADQQTAKAYIIFKYADGFVNPSKNNG